MFTQYDANGIPVVVVQETNPYLTFVRLAADHVTTSATQAEVTGLSTTLTPGVYIFQYFIIWQSNNTAAGFKLSVNFSTGTTDFFIYNFFLVDTSATASTLVADQDAVGAAGQCYCVNSARAAGTVSVNTIGNVDTANADMFTRIEGMVSVISPGDIELYQSSDGGGNQLTISTGTTLYLHRVG